MNVISRFFFVVTIIFDLKACSRDDSSVNHSLATVDDGLVGAIFTEINRHKISGFAAGLALIGSSTQLQTDN